MTPADNFKAEFPIHIYLGIHLRAHEHMGGRPDVSKHAQFVLGRY